MKKGRITGARALAARDVLAEYPFGSLDIALARLSEQFGFTVTAIALGEAFQRAGLASPEHYMADADKKHCRTCRCKRR